MKTIFFTGLLLSSVLSAHALAQDGLVVSAPEARTSFSTDYQALVNRAYPTYADADLSPRLASAARTLGARQDQVTVRNLHGIESLMGFPPTTTPGSEVTTPTAYYRVDAEKGKAHGHFKNDTYLSRSVEEFKSIQAVVARTQRGFLAKLGLPADELMKVSFKKVMVQGTAPLSGPNPSDNLPKEVRRGVTLGYRGFGGFPLDGSEARVSSYDERRIETLSLNWPVFRLHPGVTDMSLEKADAIKRAITERVKASAANGEVAVYMGVVFQPVYTLDNRLVHVPAMKVVLTPKAKLGSEDGSAIQTDAGSVFYANILRNAPAIRNDDMLEPNPRLEF